MSDDHNRIRAVLEADRVWALYALGDLEPPHAAFSEWRLAPDAEALVLLYREFPVPVLFACGPPANVAPLLANATAPLTDREFYLSIRPEILPLIQQRYRVRDLTPMWRMALGAEAFAAPVPDGVTGPSVGDYAALETLYADGAATHEAPDFFNRMQVERGVFCGAREGGELIAAAGTHLVSATFGLGAIGNVYVRRDRRGRGWGKRVTAAVTAELLRRNLATIALNVKQDNAPAIRMYEQLGFRRHCAYYEGIATRT